MKDRLDMLAALKETADNWRNPSRFTLKRLGEYLAVLGWAVTVAKREEQGAGIMHGRVFLRSPGSYSFTYFRAVKGEAVIERPYHSTRLSDVANATLRALGFEWVQGEWVQRVAEVTPISLASSATAPHTLSR